MEVIEIGATQLIFLLDRGDMTKYSIDANEDAPLMRESFSRLVTDLGVSRKFLTGVLVQIFDSKNGGCEMFVTKLPDSIGLAGDPAQTDRKYIYIFSLLDELLSACRMLSHTDGQGGCAYIDKDKKKYFLILDRECRNLCEFGAFKCRERVQEYLYEHCLLITDNAVETLAPLA